MNKNRLLPSFDEMQGLVEDFVDRVDPHAATGAEVFTRALYKKFGQGVVSIRTAETADRLTSIRVSSSDTELRVTASDKNGEKGLNRDSAVALVSFPLDQDAAKRGSSVEALLKRSTRDDNTTWPNTAELGSFSPEDQTDIIGIVTRSIYRIISELPEGVE